jgi:hypothetical protein
MRLSYQLQQALGLAVHICTRHHGAYGSALCLILLQMASAATAYAPLWHVDLNKRLLELLTLTQLREPNEHCAAALHVLSKHQCSGSIKDLVR